MPKTSKQLTISIVIPVYNEADYLPACLDAIARQSVMPLEVLVVDNNSADNSVTVAETYDFVRVLTEKKQGVVHARSHGFDIARGDIIGRIDADTIISDNWVETLQRIFETDNLDVVGGRVRYYDIALPKMINAVDLFIRRYSVRFQGREVVVQGANMALRRKVWAYIREMVCDKTGIHEDLDIGIHANKQGFNVVFDERLEAMISFRQTESTFSDYLSYIWGSPRTYTIHGLKSGRHMYPGVLLAFFSYIPLKLLRRGYNTKTKKFSVRSLLLKLPEQRVNPLNHKD